MRLMIGGGGTGGHITPGIVIAQSILKKDGESAVFFVGTEKGLEMDLVPKAGFPIATVPALPLIRKLSPSLLKTCFFTLKGVMASGKLIKSFKPDLILGTGGYVCGPLLMAALILRVPYVLQEQNVIPGLTNRLFAPFARYVALGFKEASSYFRVKKERLVFTGNPINPEILSATRLEGAKTLGIDPRKKVLLIYGGSRGSESINRAALEAYPKLLSRKDLTLLHICGRGNKESLLIKLKEQNLYPHESLHIYEYLYHISPCLGVADLVVARAGAVGLSEILSLGIPSILVPYPYAADNHQYRNAQVVEEARAGIMIQDQMLNGEILAREVSSFIQDPSRLKEYSSNAKKLGTPQATEKILALLFNESHEGIIR